MTTKVIDLSVLLEACSDHSTHIGIVIRRELANRNLGPASNYPIGHDLVDGRITPRTKSRLTVFTNRLERHLQGETDFAEEHSWNARLIGLQPQRRPSGELECERVLREATCSFPILRTVIQDTAKPDRALAGRALIVAKGLHEDQKGAEGVTLEGVTIEWNTGEDTVEGIIQDYQRLDEEAWTHAEAQGWTIAPAWRRFPNGLPPT